MSGPITNPITISKPAFEKRYDDYVRNLGTICEVNAIGSALDVIAGMRGKDKVADTWEMRILFKGMKLAKDQEGLSDWNKAVKIYDYVSLRVAQFRETERTRSKK